MFKAFADWLVGDIFKMDLTSKLGGAVHFFVWDVTKILILLSCMIFIISYIRSYFSPTKTKKVLEKITGIKAHVVASLLGIITPFCSCSSVPLFIGFVEAGIPLGVTFSFLITSPIVNEFAMGMLFIAFGWKIALTYIIAGVVIGVVGGIIIDKLKLEKYVEEYVYKMKMGSHKEEVLTLKQRLEFAKENVIEIVKRVWLFVIIGIGIGAAIHGLVPKDFLATHAGPNNPFAVLIGVVAGIPLYSNAMGALPIAAVLIDKGVGIGTALSFVMAVTALSLPEMIILRKVIKTKLIAIFVAITGIAIIIVGYYMNFMSNYLM